MIYCMDCVDGMKMLPDESVDHAVFSPPYDGLRDYKGFSVNLPAVGEELFRVLKPGAIAAMVIQDQTKDFAKSLTSFRTIVDWCDRVGFRLFECVIYRRPGTEGGWWSQRFRVDHEYIPLFLKGDRPSFFNKEPLKIKSIHAGKISGGSVRRQDGSLDKKSNIINPLKCRGTVWDIFNRNSDSLKKQHPAVFPDAIPRDTITCFCPPGGLVMDPFSGSGTTAIEAMRLGREFIGFDVSQDYCDLANERISLVRSK